MWINVMVLSKLLFKKFSSFYSILYFFLDLVCNVNKRFHFADDKIETKLWRTILLMIFVN